MLAHPDSVAHARAEFANHHVWVTQHRDDELYSGGKYTNQSWGDAEGIRTWVDRQDNTDNDDIVVWHSFGLTHNTRIEASHPWLLTHLLEWTAMLIKSRALPCLGLACHACRGSHRLTQAGQLFHQVARNRRSFVIAG